MEASYAQSGERSAIRPQRRGANWWETIKAQSRTWRRSPIFLSLIIYTALIVVTTIPTWDVYMWWGHYQIFPLSNVYQVSKQWAAQGFGHVPWFPDSCFGYGYPFLTFYSPLGYYVGAIFHFVLGLDYGAATKLSFYASLYVSGLLMYAFVYLIGSREGSPRLAWWSLAAATVYALSRYHLTDVFVRDTIGESWAWAALPGVYLGMELARRHPWPGLLLTSVTYAGLVLSHNVTAMWASLFIAAYPFVTAHNLKWLLTVAAGGLLGSGLSAFSWYPGLKLSGLTHKAGDVGAMWALPWQVHQQALFWRQHFVEALGYGASTAIATRDLRNETLGINLGFATLIVILLSTLAVFQRGLKPGQRYRLILFLVMTFLLLFIMSPQMPWQFVPELLRYVQFPWRLMILTAFFGSAAIAMASPVTDRWVHPGILVGLAAMFAIPTLPMIVMPAVIKHMSPEQIASWTRRWERQGFYAGTLDQVFMPKWVKGDYLNPRFLADHPIPQNRLTLVSGDMVCNSYNHRGTVYEYRYTSSAPSEARIAVFYWPGWELRIDGKLLAEGVKLGADGLVSVTLPAGEHTAELRYNLSPQGKLGRALSIAAAVVWFVILGLWIGFRRRQALAQA
jgi:hypothetical protein